MIEKMNDCVKDNNKSSVVEFNCGLNWSFDWTDILNQSYDFSFFELQFANCKRLEYNDDIYIFDEVGTGKTISSGLMALHYIYNKYTWEKEYEEVLGHKRLVNDKQRVIKGEEVDTDVLVITVNAVTDQFKKDWSKTLNFNEETINSEEGKKVFKDFNPYSNGRVKFINNIVSQDGNYEFAHFDSNKKIGLLVVDEAHLFVKDNTDINVEEENSKRFNALKKLNAEKVIFLTATPNRYDKSNLDKYVEIACKILNKDNTDKRKEDIKKCFGKVEDESDLICCKLDFNMCATRYFKDTVRKIQNKNFEKTKAKRWIPEIWKNPLNLGGVNYDNNFVEKFYNNIENIKENYYNKYKYNTPFNDSIFFVLYNLCEIRDSDKKVLKDRFIIFIDRIESGQNIIEDHMKFINDEFQDDKFFGIKFCEYDNQRNNKNDITYKIVNSNTYEKAQDYSESENVPDILIVISRAVEQGVNLPAYSYIISFDVNKSVAALEQRFGRIDRINDTKYTDIHTVYVLDYREKNQDNFITAMINYRDMIEGEFTIPSKNVVINKTTLDYFANDSMIELHIKSLEEQKKLINSIKDRIIQGCNLRDLNINIYIYNYISELNNELERLNNQSNNVDRRRIVDKTLEDISKELKDLDKIKQLRKSFEVDGNKDILDSIFYSKQHKLATIKGIDCAKYILDKGAKMEELRQLNPVIKLFDEKNDVISIIERELEYSFLFKDYYYRKIAERVVLINDMYFDEVLVKLPVTEKDVGIPAILKYSIDNLEYDGKLNGNNFDDLLKTFVYKNFELLPFFRFIDEFKKIVSDYKNQENYDLKKLFDDLKIKTQNTGLSKEFEAMVFINDVNEHFRFYDSSEYYKYIHASPFLKILIKTVVESKKEFIDLHREVLEDNKNTYKYSWDVDFEKNYKEFFDKLNKEELIYVNSSGGYYVPMFISDKVDMSEYIDNELKNDMFFLQQLNINKKIDRESIGFDSYTSKIAYYYLNCNYENLKSSFKFRGFNKVIPFAKCRSKQQSNYNDYIDNDLDINVNFLE